ncbi:PQQ-binding-like beta-propeller repeat protein [Actinoplanes teichomyceticus]|uniref:outer membrane protein assembly factor BamB family protein n=1 Tax=Actinoplanes teichomyceticus TaxID=1867 RepID=UPI0013DD9507|nr:PQQ-binding-like beta-propeller repeat protein [Actinoplanes teichomyceticus]GIF11322.1 hypothetical protein Ate01nite_13540 [Actinoplanes teichomyceticus]
MQALRRTVTALVFVGLALPGPAQAATPRWDHPGYDAEDSWFNPHEAALTPATVGRLTRSWSVHLRHLDESCSGFSAPVLGAGRVFATDRAGVSAYRPSSGALSWRFTWEHADDNSTARLAVAGDLLILANGDCNSMSDPDGRLTALDTATGRVRWRLEPDNPIDSVVVDKNVVLVSGTSPSDEDRVAAYRVRDGRLLWSRPRHASSGVSADGLVPLATTDGSGVPTGTTVAVDIATGAPRWSRRATWQVQAASPAADRFYVTDRSGVLLSVDARTGAVLLALPGRGTPLLATDGPRLYVADGVRLTALAAGTGRALWSYTFPGPITQPVLAGGLVYTGSRVLNASTGAPAGPTVPGGVIVTGGRLYQVNGPRLTTYLPELRDRRSELGV